MPKLRVALPAGAVVVSVLTACGSSAAAPRTTAGSAASQRSTAGHQPATGRAAGPGATVAPGAAGPAVLVVWRTGRDVFGSALDGRGSRRLLRVPKASRPVATPAPDGTRVAFLDGDRLRVLRLADGGVDELGTVDESTSVLRWSPDGARVAAVAGDGLQVCAAGSGCRRWTGRLADGTGATWSPDGRRIAVIVFPEPGRDGREEQRVTVADGRTSRTVSRLRSSADGERYTQVTAPVWARAGLAWAELDLRLQDGELAGITRARVRLHTGGRTRTLTSTRPTGAAYLPFQVAGEAVDGSLLGIRTGARRTASTFDLRTLAVDGAPRSAGVPLGTFDPGTGNPSAEILGTLDDGRIAIAVRPVETRPFRLYFATPGKGAGPVVRRADEIAVATTRPGNPVEE